MMMKPSGVIDLERPQKNIDARLITGSVGKRNHVRNKRRAYVAYGKTNPLSDGTYEAVGKHFNANPYNMENDILMPHGYDLVDVERNFDAIKQLLTELDTIEGIVFWLNGIPVCKIKRTDFGLKWPVKGR